jgi:putative ABC transport system substrate-binding protein
MMAAAGKPIVLLAIDFDPVTSRYVASLSRPGGSVTGIFVRQLELAAKRVEIAREAFSRARARPFSIPRAPADEKQRRVARPTRP